MIKAVVSRLFPVGSFARHVGLLSLGTTLAQAIAALALPILTRLYSPEDFSLLAVYTALLSLGVVVACLRYNLAIPIPDNDDDAFSLLAVALMAAFVISTVLAIIAALVPNEFVALLRQPSLRPYLWMVPLGVFVAASYDALQYWTSRKKRFSLITKTRVTRALGGAGLQVGIGSVSPSPFGLIFGNMIYGGLGVVGLAVNLIKHDAACINRVSWHQMRDVAKSYHRFPLFSVPEALLNTAGIQLPIIVIAAIAAGPEAGYLTIAMTIMGAPMALIGSSVAQVYLVEAPSHFRKGTLEKFTRTTLWTLFKTGTLPLFLIGMAAPFFFPVLFGEEWSRAGRLLAWMTPWFLLQFITSPLSAVLLVVNRQNVAMLLQAFGMVLRLGMIYGAYLWMPNFISEAYAASGAIFYGVYLLVIREIVKRAR